MALTKSKCGACGQEYTGPFHSCARYPGALSTTGTTIFPPSVEPYQYGLYGGTGIIWDKCNYCGEAIRSDQLHSCSANKLAPSSALSAQLDDARTYLYNSLWERTEMLEKKIDTLTAALTDLLREMRKL